MRARVAKDLHDFEPLGIERLLQRSPRHPVALEILRQIQPR